MMITNHGHRLSLIMVNDHLKLVSSPRQGPVRGSVVGGSALVEPNVTSTPGTNTVRHRGEGVNLISQLLDVRYHIHLRQDIVPYSILCYLILFYCIKSYQITYIVLYSIIFFFILFYSIIFYYILLYSIMFLSITFYYILLCYILFYSILFYSILFYDVI